MPSLKTINIGTYNMKNVRNFTLDVLESLESLTINEYSLRISSSTQKSGSEVRITHCPNLVSITVYRDVLSDFQKLTMYNLTSLESITTYDYSFYSISTIQLSGILVMKNQ